MILAMPGSGKTRTVVEAARSRKGMQYKRFRMLNHKFESADSVQKFLEASAATTCGVGESPFEHDDVVVVHFDEIQSLMVPRKGSEEPWVDVAYSIKVPNCYTAAHGLQIGIPKELEASYDKLFQTTGNFAQPHPHYYFVAAFVCEFEFPKQAMEIDLPKKHDYSHPSD
jgi:hypothetical protein